MKLIVTLLFAFGLLIANTFAADWVEYPGKNGPGKGKHIVLISGDEEYRSEEALPMLGKILSQRHGFDCTVLFAIDPATGEINPNILTNIPGIEKVADADLVILFTRFRELPDDKMKYFVDYLKDGKPIIAIRTGTHAFNYKINRQSPYARFDFASREWPGGFGQQVLGETWVNHHGAHKSESTRGLIEGLHERSPILKGVKDIWGPTDVYGIVHLPSSADILIEGLSLRGMAPDALPNYNKSIMPIIWMKDYQLDGGKVGKALTSTIGASVDLQCEDLRRLFVNASYWMTGLGKSIPDRADVAYVGAYKPTFFGFNEFVKGKHPSDYDLK